MNSYYEHSVYNIITAPTLEVFGWRTKMDSRQPNLTHRLKKLLGVINWFKKSIIFKDFIFLCFVHQNNYQRCCDENLFDPTEKFLSMQW